MFNTKFGIEIEMTGITRSQAAKAAAAYLGGTVTKEGGSYDTYKVTDTTGRTWKFMSDGSINCLKKVSGNIVSADRAYSVELVSPILTDADIEPLQEIIRKLRAAGAFTNNTCGIHVHLSEEGHTAKTIRNFINIIASKNDLLYKALQIAPERMHYCKKMDEFMVERMNKTKPQTLKAIENIWYSNFSEDRNRHYHNSRYFFLNLHSLWQGTGLELRGFNAGKDGKLHAGLVRSYILLALCINQQALTQRYASPKKNQEFNEKFAMRTWLVRMGMVGDVYKTPRTMFCEALDGNAAWRLGSRENTPRRQTQMAVATAGV